MLGLCKRLYISSSPAGRLFRGRAAIENSLSYRLLESCRRALNISHSVEIFPLLRFYSVYKLKCLAIDVFFSVPERSKAWCDGVRARALYFSDSEAERLQAEKLLFNQQLLNARAVLENVSDGVDRLDV